MWNKKNKGEQDKTRKKADIEKERKRGETEVCIPVTAAQ